MKEPPLQAEDSTTDAPSPAEEIDRPAAPRPDRSRGWLLAWLAALWLAVIVAVWFGLHPLFQVEFPLFPKEITARIPAALFNSLAAVVGLALCCLGSLAAGLTLLRWAGRPIYAVMTTGERLLFGLALGLGLNIMLVLALGLLGGVNRPVAYALLLVELGLVWPWRAWLTGAVRQGWLSLTDWRTGAAWWEKALALWLALAGLLTLGLALAPPLAWDALMYHLEGPRRYIEAGRIEHLPRLGQASFPFGAEMLFTWGMLLQGDGLAQSFSWLYGLLGAAGCGVFARRFLSQPAGRPFGLLAAALYLSVPHVWLLQTWAYTDTMLTAYALLAFHALLLAVGASGQRPALAWAVLAGVMAGLAGGGKYTAALAGAGALAGAVYYGLAGRPQRPFKTWLFIVAGYGLAALISFAPWLARNIAFSGNPLAPLFGGIRGWPPEEIAALAGQDGGVPLDLTVVLGRPFQLALLGRSGGLYDATLSPLFLALLPLGVWVAWRARVIAAAWLAIGVIYLGWLAGIRLSAAADHARLLLPVLPLLAIITAYALLEFCRVWAGTGFGLLLKLAPLAVGLFLAASFFMLVLFFVANDPLPYHFGFQSREERLHNQLGPYYRAVSYVNRNLPAQARLYLFFEPRAYYFERSLSPDHNGGGQFFYYVTRFRTPEAIQAELRRQGATHALVNEFLLEFLEKTPEYNQVDKARAGRQALEGLVEEGYFIKIYEEKGQYTLYRLAASL